MDMHDSAEAVEVLDLLLKFFGDGQRWVRGRLNDRRGNRCLVGALDFVSSHHGMKGDAAERYLSDEISATAACNDALNVEGSSGHSPLLSLLTSQTHSDRSFQDAERRPQG